MPQHPSRHADVEAALQPDRERRTWLRQATGWLLVATLTPSPPAAQAASGEVAIGQALRDANLRGLNGPSRKLSAFFGKPLIINVWASWCGPCREEAASLERLAWGPLAASFAIIGISTDDYREEALAWLRRSNATISHFIDHDLEMEHMLGAKHLPLTVLVDARGHVLDRVYGAQDWDSPQAARRIAHAFGLTSPLPGATQAAAALAPSGAGRARSQSARSN